MIATERLPHVFVAQPRVFLTFTKRLHDLRPVRQAMRRLFLDAYIIDVNRLNRNTEPAHYETVWQGLIEQCASFVFATRDNGWAGNGIWRELLHARKCGIPCHILNADDGSLHREFYVVERGEAPSKKFRISFTEREGATLVSL